MIKDDTIDYAKIPDRILGALDRWRLYGIWPGGCLRHLLCGKIIRAYRTMDKETFAALRHLIAYISEKMPEPCWGDVQTANWWHTALTGAREVYLAKRGEVDAKAEVAAEKAAEDEEQTERENWLAERRRREHKESEA